MARNLKKCNCTNEVMEHLIPAPNIRDTYNVKLIFAFNGVGKTQLSKRIIDTVKEANQEILYYNAYTEDLFSWDNGIGGKEPELLLDDRGEFIREYFDEQGAIKRVQENFKKYVRKPIEFDNLTSEETGQTDRFKFKLKGEEYSIKISKGEESIFIWSIFSSFLEDVINELGEDVEDKVIQKFTDIKYIVIDDPVTSLDEQYIIRVANGIADMIHEIFQFKLKAPGNAIYPKIIVMTHHPLFFNVLFNEIRKIKKCNNYILGYEEGEYYLNEISTDSPFAYHVELLKEIKQSISSEQIKKYHFGFLRQIMEKSMTFTGQSNLKEFLNILNKQFSNNELSEINRLLNLYSHGKHSDLEAPIADSQELELFKRLFNEIVDSLHFKV